MRRRPTEISGFMKYLKGAFGLSLVSMTNEQKEQIMEEAEKFLPEAHSYPHPRIHIIVPKPFNLSDTFENFPDGPSDNYWEVAYTKQPLSGVVYWRFSHLL